MGSRHSCLAPEANIGVQNGLQQKLGIAIMKQLSLSYSHLSAEDPIEELHLTNRPLNALKGAGIWTVGELFDFIKSDNLNRIRALGAKSINEIQSKLAQVKFQNNSKVEDITQKNDIPRRVVKWQLQLVSKQLSRGLLHEDVKIAGKSIREWGAETEKRVSNQTYEVLSTILGTSINICEEIEYFLSYFPGQSAMTILVFRYGFESKTLEQTGVEIGITRERVRQLENEIKNTTISISNLKSRPILLRMQSALLIARDLELDITYENWTQRIRTSGLVGDWTSQDFADMDAIEVMIAISKLATECKIPWLRIPENLQYAMQLAISGTPGIPAKIPYVLKTLSEKVRKLIDRHVRFSGGVYAKWLSQELGMELERVSDILQALEYTSLLDGWYIPKVRCSPFEITRDEVFHRCMCKMLQYCGQLSIDDICAGIRHGISRSGFSEPEYLASKDVDRSRSMFPVPPPDVMAEILRINGYQCQDELYSWDGEIDEKLSTGETIIMNCLDNIGPVLHHSELADAFTESDLSFPSMHPTLNRSPLFQGFDRGLYKLRGKEVTNEEIERAKAAGERHSLDLEEEYDTNGNIILSITVGSTAVRSGIIYSEQIRDLSGDWPCYVNGVNAGELIATENEFRHLREPFELLNCKLGNRLKFTFNMWKRTVVIELTEANAQA